MYLNIKKCILILLKNYTIWSHNLVLLLLKKELYLVKSRLWASMNRKVSAAAPNFGRGFRHPQHPLYLRNPGKSLSSRILIDNHRKVFIEISTNTQSHPCLLLQSKIFCKNVHRWLCLSVKIFIDTFIINLLSKMYLTDMFF